MDEFITCPLCGKSVKRLKKHLRMAKEHKTLDVDKWLTEHPDIQTVSDVERNRYIEAQRSWCATPDGKHHMSRMSKKAWSDENSRQRLLEGRRKQHESEEFKKQHREVARQFMTQKMSEPEFYEKAMRNIQSKGKRLEFVSFTGEVIKLRSELEYGIATYLKEHNLDFRYEKDPIQYVGLDGRIHSYYVDFYIPSLDLAIEGKPKQLWSRDDTQIKLCEAKKHFKTVMLVAYDLTELDSFIGSVTTIENIANEKDISEEVSRVHSK